MAVTAFNTTTLSEALEAGTNDFTVASTTNITVKDLLVIRDEVVKVQEIPVAGRVKVMRGVNGTEARAHVSGQRVFIIANPEDARTQRDGQLSIIGASGVYPDYLFPGARAFDGAGNEYVMVDLTATMYGGTTVLISHDGLFTASVLATGAQGSVGIVVEQGSSDQYVWAQIYGYNPHAQLVLGSSLATSTGVLQIASSVSTPSVGLLAATTSLASSVTHGSIYGMHLASAATTATTAATSATGLYAAVWLNYPFVMRIVSS